MTKMEKLLGTEQQAQSFLHKVRQGDEIAVMSARIALLAIDNPLILADLMEFVYEAAKSQISLAEECRG